MILRISPDRMVSEIQKDFNSRFPFLKIEFFMIKAREALLSPKHSSIQNYRISNLPRAICGGNIEITEEMSVMELKDIFKAEFGLVLRVFRCSGNLWLETSMTDNWTLRQQNNHGRELSSVDERRIL